MSFVVMTDCRLWSTFWAATLRFVASAEDSIGISALPRSSAASAFSLASRMRSRFQTSVAAAWESVWPAFACMVLRALPKIAARRTARRTK